MVMLPLYVWDSLWSIYSAACTHYESFSSCSFIIVICFVWNSKCTFNNSFHLLATFPYRQLLTAYAYLSGASVTVSPEWQITPKLLLLALALYLYLNNQLEILSGSRWGINICIWTCMSLFLKVTMLQI